MTTGGGGRGTPRPGIRSSFLPSRLREGPEEGRRPQSKSHEPLPGNFDPEAETG